MKKEKNFKEICAFAGFNLSIAVDLERTIESFIRRYMGGNLQADKRINIILEGMSFGKKVSVLFKAIDQQVALKKIDQQEKLKKDITTAKEIRNLIAHSSISFIDGKYNFLGASGSLTQKSKSDIEEYCYFCKSAKEKIMKLLIEINS